VFTGQLGCPESRVEMHCEQFDDLAELDAFFAALPLVKHRAWGEAFAEHVVDGSPTWHVLRVVPVRGPAPTPPPGARSAEVRRATRESRESKNTSLSFVDDAADAAAAVAAAAAFDVTYNGGGLIDGMYADETVTDDVIEAPPRVKPRAPKRLTKEQMDVPVFAANHFGENAEGLVFPQPRDGDDGDDGDEDGVDLSEYEPGSKVVMDWKGEPMVIQPGDKLPNVQ
jgi:hypothetical protein